MAIYFDLETRTFGVNIGGLSKLTKPVSKWLGSEGAAKTSMALGIGGAAIGLGSGLIGTAKMLQDNRFSVIGLVNGKPVHKSVRAKSPVDAVNKVKQSNANLTSARAFRLPDQDDQSQEYYESLLRKN